VSKSIVSARPLLLANNQEILEAQSQERKFLLDKKDMGSLELDIYGLLRSRYRLIERY
jgi:hypothetical protein